MDIHGESDVDLSSSQLSLSGISDVSSTADEQRAPADEQDDDMSNYIALKHGESCILNLTSKFKYL